MTTITNPYVIIICVSTFSFVVGCLLPFLSDVVELVIENLFKVRTQSSILVTTSALLIGFGISGVGLALINRLFTDTKDLSPFLALAFMLGLGLARWLRREI